jgi:hypothetical protein
MDQRHIGLERELGALECLCVIGGFRGAQRCLTVIEGELHTRRAPGIDEKNLWHLFDRLRDSVTAGDADQVAVAVSDLRSALGTWEQWH